MERMGEEKLKKRADAQKMEEKRSGSRIEKNSKR